MNVSLPDSLQGWIDTQVRLGGHASVDLYLEKLLREEQTRWRREIDQKLIEGLESGEPANIDGAFWEERRHVLEERLRNSPQVTTP